MTAFLGLAVALAAPPPGWAFVDEAKLAGRSLLTFRTVELADQPARPPHADDRPPAGARFGELPLGSRGKHRLPVVWHAGTNAVWVDADADGRFTPAERHTLRTDPLELKVTLPATGEGPPTRTLLIRKRGDGLAHAVRGYRAGPLVLGVAPFPAMLTDADADGGFADPAADRLWVDADRDGTFDPLTEQFPLGRPVTVGGVAYLVRADAATGTVTAAPRSVDAGSLILNVSREPGATVVGFRAQLVSEWGELVTVDAAEVPQVVPVGRYRVDGLKLRLADADGRVWTYDFYGPDKYLVTVDKGRSVALDLTAGLKAAVAMNRSSAAAGGSVDVSPAVVTAGGLTLHACERLDKFTDRGLGLEAVVALEAPGSETVCEVRAGFL